MQDTVYLSTCRFVAEFIIIIPHVLPDPADVSYMYTLFPPFVIGAMGLIM